MTFYIFNNIYIHSWGGLGSQLFAYSTAEYLGQRYPKKQISIVLHSSGVTKRAPAIDFLGEKYRIIVKDDFDDNSKNNTNVSKSRLILKQIVKTIMEKSHLVLEGNSTLEQGKIKPWTLVLRGHYSYAEISKNTLKIMAKKIENLIQPGLRDNFKKASYIGLHYRLGDLIKLDNKSHIKPDLISTYVLQVAKDNHINDIHVYSDDLVLARNLLSDKLNDLAFFNEADIWVAVVNLMHSDYFIGTNSKISVWIILFRLLNDPNSWNAIPLSMKENLEKIWPQISISKNMFYY
jgi:hypothetical protein